MDGWPLLAVPINLNTFEQLLGRPSTSEEMEATSPSGACHRQPKNSEEVIVSQVGTKLYEMFFKNYTRKQWQRDARDLDPSVAAASRSGPTATTVTCRKNFKRCPKTVTPRCSRRCSHIRRSRCDSNTDFREARETGPYRHLIFTGPIDEYFDHCFGHLPYRSLRFEPETLEQEFFQPAMQVNYPNDHDFTRIVEVKHATDKRFR